MSGTPDPVVTPDKPTSPESSIGGAGGTRAGGAAAASGDFDKNELSASQAAAAEASRAATAAAPWSDAWVATTSRHPGTPPPCADEDERRKRDLMHRALVTALELWRSKAGAVDGDDEAAAIARGVQAAVVAATEEVAARAAAEAAGTASEPGADADAAVGGAGSPSTASCLPPCVVLQLLANDGGKDEDEDTGLTVHGELDAAGPDADSWSLQGFPRAPYVRFLAAVLARWWSKRAFPLAFAPMEHFVQVLDSLRHLVDPATSAAVIAQCDRLEASCASRLHAGGGDADTRLGFAANEEGAVEVAGVVDALLRAVGGVRGVMHLLGMRRTFKSVQLLPPSRSQLEASFEALHSADKPPPKKGKPSQLTVGARALTKHCHRASDGWWGTSGGSEAAKNAWGKETLARILDGATWMNVHLLPHAKAIIEVRIAEGYGARWTADGSSFRGFLEPHREGGHLEGWKH